MLKSFDSIDNALILDLKESYEGSNIFNSMNDLLGELKNVAQDYDIILIMTNKDSQKFIQPLKNYLEK